MRNLGAWITVVYLILALILIISDIKYADRHSGDPKQSYTCKEVGCLELAEHVALAAAKPDAKLYLRLKQYCFKGEAK